MYVSVNDQIIFYPVITKLKCSQATFPCVRISIVVNVIKIPFDF